MTLTEFLEARIAEDEAHARSALGSARWKAVQNDHGGDLSQEVTAEVWTEPYESPLDRAPRPRLVCKVGPDDGFPSLTHATYDARHIARHDPARVLAKCEADRRIVEYAEGCSEIAALKGDAFAKGMHAASMHALRRLALPYADHPDYRQEWKP